MPVPLAPLTTLRLGGAARRLVEATTQDELVATVRDADAAGEPVLIIGGGSNLVLSDAGWDGVAVLVRTRGITAEPDGDRVTVTAEAGEPWDALVAHTVAQGWSGLAAMSGIPGLTGATPVQNVGAYGSEVADRLGSVRVFDRLARTVEDWPAERCGFGFRTSAFKHTDRYVVLSVAFALTVSTYSVPVRYLELARRLGVEPDHVAPSAEVREVVLDLRRSKGMLLDAEDHDTWSVGSFFVNPFVDPAQVPDGAPAWESDGRVKLSAGWLIETAGFGRGFGHGGPVAVSGKHSLALTNRGGASTEQLLELARGFLSQFLAVRAARYLHATMLGRLLRCGGFGLGCRDVVWTGVMIAVGVRARVGNKVQG